MVALKRSPGISSGCPAVGVSSTLVTRPSSLSISTAVDLAVGHGRKGVGRLHRRQQSERYISVVTRATSLALLHAWICSHRSRMPRRS